MILIRLVDRLVLMAFAAVAAAVAALGVGIAGLVNHQFGADIATIAQTLGLWAVATVARGGTVPDIGALLQQAATTGLMLWLAPIVLVAVIGEVWGKASWIFYVVGMALAFAAAPIAATRSPLLLIAIYQAILGLLAIGVVAGAVYWAIAGRSASRAPVIRQSETQRPPSP